MKVTQEFVAAIKVDLEARGWSQTHFADKVGETRFWVSKLLGGKLINVREDQVLRIEAVLELILMRLLKTRGRENDFGSDEFVMVLAEQLRSSAPAHEAFASLFRLLHDNQLYELPELDIRHLKSLGEEIHRLSVKAGSEPVAAARVLMAHLREILLNGRGKVRR